MPSVKETLTITQIVEAQRQFLKRGGIVYDPEFIKVENLDPRKKVVFDLNGTLIPSDPDLESVEPRGGALDVLRFLRAHNVKNIIWTAANRRHCQKALSKTGLVDYIDLSITWENYNLKVGRMPAEIKIFQDRFSEICEWQRKYSGPIKALQYTPYKLLVDDDWGMRYIAEEEGFTLIYVPYYAPEIGFGIEDNLPADLGERIIEILK